MKVSDLMRAMSDAGAPMEAILIAVKAIEENEAELDAIRAVARENTRRYRQRGGGQVSAQVRAQILERDNHACLECGSDDGLEIDHIIPLMAGGDPVDPENLQTLCRPCNARKRDRIRKTDNRGKLRTNSNSAIVTAEAPLSLPPNENISNPPTHTPGINTRARKGQGVSPLAAKPDDVSADVWRDFQTLRKRKGAPLTETALNGIADEARNAGWPLDAALRKCVVRGWQGFEADWLKGEKPPGGSAANDVDPLMRSILALKAREAPA